MATIERVFFWCAWFFFFFSFLLPSVPEQQQGTVTAGRENDPSRSSGGGGGSKTLFDTRDKQNAGWMSTKCAGVAARSHGVPGRDGPFPVCVNMVFIFFFFWPSWLGNGAAVS